MSSAQSPAFTLRFRNAETHRALRLTAELLGVSMNELAEAAIAHELAIVGAELEENLTRAAELLKSYRGQGIEKDIEAFAKAEVSMEDPLRSRMIDEDDAYGIGALFARPVEQR
jgi:hypothetical protein